MVMFTCNKEGCVCGGIGELEVLQEEKQAGIPKDNQREPRLKVSSEPIWSIGKPGKSGLAAQQDRFESVV
jgi:hypothetical protein